MCPSVRVSHNGSTTFTCISPQITEFKLALIFEASTYEDAFEMTAQFFFEVERDAFKKRLAEVLAILCIDICISCGFVLKVVNLYCSKEALEATLKKKRECNAKALHVVECMLENTISEDEFLDCVSTVACNVWHCWEYPLPACIS